MLTALQGHFTKISSKVRKVRREREWSVSTACSVYCRSNDDRTRKVFRSRRNFSSDGASRSRI